jgi:digeranylgeranylglycerophospholipid reductase
MKCDVLVVGAGPAGCGVAKAAAEKGTDVLVIDKKKEIGVPVECGECVGISLPKFFGIKIPSNVISSKQNSAIFYLNREMMIENSEQYWKSVSIERKMLDKHFAIEATRAGAKVLADTELINVKKENRKIVSLKVKSSGKFENIEPKIVVAADGSHSTVAKELGIKLFDNKQMAYSIEYEMAGIKLKHPNSVQIFLDENIGYGYGWIIPKGKDRANVGVGNLGFKKINYKLEDFINNNPIVKSQTESGSILEFKRGDTPITGPIDKLVWGNVIFVGDAAGQNIAHVGEGTFPSYIAGGIAGECASKAVKTKDIKNSLDKYPMTIKKVLGEILGLGGDIKNCIVNTWSSDLTKKKKFLVGGLLMSETLRAKNFSVKSFLKLSEEEIVNGVKEKIKSERRKIRFF